MSFHGHNCMTITDYRRPIPFILSANGQEMQHKLWDETLVEVTKADPSVAAVVKLLR